MPCIDNRPNAIHVISYQAAAVRPILEPVRPVYGRRGSRGALVGTRVTIDLGSGAVVDAEVLAPTDGSGGDPMADASGDWGAGGDAAARNVPAAATAAVAMQLDAVQSVIRRMGEWAAETVEGMAADRVPERFEVEFGVKLGVKSGRLVGILAEVGGEASLVVRMAWSPDTAAASPGASAPPNSPSPSGAPAAAGPSA